VKCLFVGAPAWRVFGLDQRLSEDLARMALDLADERRSAHRSVQPDLWLLLGPHAGERGLASIERELATRANPPAEPGGAPGLDPTNTAGRAAASAALARAGETERLSALAASETDPFVADVMRDALAGRADSSLFRRIAERELVS
jgi:hypothetical protein